MKRFGEQLNKKAHGVRLSSAERALLRERVVSYMEYHPLPKEARERGAAPAIVSEPYTAVSINYRFLSSFVGAFAVLTLIIVPVVAERAVPGDVLYPVKVQFNEELRSTLSFSPYAKVEWETKRLERRLAEARLLADEGKLTEEIEAEVAVAVQAHSDAAKQEIEAIRANDSDEAAIAEIAFASALEVQSEVLESREAQAGEVGRSVAALAGVVAEARSGVEASQETANPSYEKLLARLEMETTNAQELFTSIKESASAEEIADIERRFADVKRKIDQAIALHQEMVEADQEVVITASTTPPANENADLESKRLLKAALTDTRKLVTFMTDIDVRNSVSIETLVPLTLTDEEVRAMLTQRLQAVTAGQTRIETMEPYEDTVEKFAAGKETFDRTVTAAEAAFAADDLIAAAQLLDEAELMLADLERLGDVTAVPVTPKATSTKPVEIEGATTTPSSTEAAELDETEEGTV